MTNKNLLHVLLFSAVSSSLFAADLNSHPRFSKPIYQGKHIFSLSDKAFKEQTDPVFTFSDKGDVLVTGEYLHKNSSHVNIRSVSPLSIIDKTGRFSKGTWDKINVSLSDVLPEVRGNGSDYSFLETAVDDSGKSYLAGFYAETKIVNNDYDYSFVWFVVRIDEKGNLDKSFGENGVKKTVKKTATDVFIPQKMILSENADVYLLGRHIGTKEHVAIIKLQENGQIDANFGKNGSLISSIEMDGTSSKLNFATIKNDKVYLRFSYNNRSKNLLLASLDLTDGKVTNLIGNKDWKIETESEDTNGYAQTTFFDKIAFTDDEHILLFGKYNDYSKSNEYYFMSKVDLEGEFEPSFGEKASFFYKDKDDKKHYGRWKPILDMNIEAINNVAVSSDGRIALVGGTSGRTVSSSDSTAFILDKNGNKQDEITLDVSKNDRYDAIFALNFAEDGVVLGGEVSLGTAKNRFYIAKMIKGQNNKYQLDEEYGLVDDEKPVPSSLNGDVIFQEGGKPVILDNSVVIYDRDSVVKENGAGDYQGVSLTIQKEKGASTDDLFIGSGNLKLLSNKIKLSDKAVGDYQLTDGKLTLVFNKKISQVDINEVASSIAYANQSQKITTGKTSVAWELIDQSREKVTGKTELTLVAKNNPPVIAGVPKDVQEIKLQPISFTSDPKLAEITITDPDSDALILEISVLNGELSGVQKTLTGTAQEITTELKKMVFEPTKAGYASIAFTLKDDTGLTAKESYSFNVANQKGTVSVNEEIEQNQILKAEIKDDNGLPDKGIEFVWLLDGSEIKRAKDDNTLQLTQKEVEKSLVLNVNYIDLKSNREQLTLALGKVKNVNDPAKVKIAGKNSIGEILQAEIADIDGVPDVGINYVWSINGNPISNANTDKYQLVKADASKEIQVTVTFTDKLGGKEKVTSEKVLIASDTSDPIIFFDSFEQR